MNIREHQHETDKFLHHDAKALSPLIRVNPCEMHESNRIESNQDKYLIS